MQSINHTTTSKTSNLTTTHTTDDEMASMIARRAALSSRALSNRAFTTSARRFAESNPALKAETKRNPELIVRHIPNTLPADARPQQRLPNDT